ncbi:hypothetical protein COT75_05040 [Candidatus Beckwithbacteria bacterium CG10_big_fil_rev_8_21_14_0_10_34_10]|uniref:Glycosyl transferase family 1 domain-containing protein n=1 Tax=Candidatus Beckwithbacteria bacterium CG10_big_fil_rev_8_21_14_0_10_34_10 TaxID=1974495 RepID=A0A2H0W835_9BACT|nr:MAG: hypothetical protein COT75_05040 [Candidatus Beckwithbacteria bacterium CG10_big_fil_rev_8_21_14_0_10_34_10]
MKLNQKKIILVSNITDHSGPTEGLADFLLKNSKTLLTIYHPFFYCHDKKSKVNFFSKSELIKKIASPSLALPEFLKYFTDLILTFYYALKFKQKFDLYIGVNCLHAGVGIIFKKLGLVKKVVFYTIDWMPQRFNNPFFNWLYYKVDKFSINHSDSVWNLSQSIVKIRKKQNLPSSKNIFVPNGINFKEIKKVKKNKIKRKTLVLLGALHPSKGVDLVIKALPLLWKKFPQLKLVVIGSTPKIKQIKNYEKIFSSMGRKVIIKGILPHQKILSFLPQFGIALAPYHPQKNNFSYYAWPARVIDYLACQLPVIITPVPQVAKNIQEKKAGVLIKYNEKELVKAVGKLLTNDQFYWQARKNAFKLVKHLSWNNIFEKALEKIYN